MGSSRIMKVHSDFFTEVKDISKAQQISGTMVTRQIAWLLRSRKFKESKKEVSADVSPFFKF